ncbi:MAG TPA: hypothetical protein VKB78_14260 [Pirellulales bacterium]|nr:hypothetical protein [Pirellulales bacterium]
MYTFHVTVHLRPAEAVAGPTIEVGRRKLATLAVPHDARSRPFGIAFEETVGRLNGLERMFTEPDGSFVWTSPHDGPSWQVDGNLFDRGARLLFVDLKGNCPAEEFNRLLSAFGWPDSPLIFQLVREAVFLDETEFRRWAIE